MGARESGIAVLLYERLAVSVDRSRFFDSGRLGCQTLLHWQCETRIVPSFLGGTLQGTIGFLAAEQAVGTAWIACLRFVVRRLGHNHAPLEGTFALSTPGTHVGNVVSGDLDNHGCYVSGPGLGKLDAAAVRVVLHISTFWQTQQKLDCRRLGHFCRRD